MDTLDHTTLMPGRVTDRFKDKTKFLAFINALAAQVQEIEDAYQDLYLNRSIANGVGAQLDDIGDIIGQKRHTSVDTDYRPYLYARIATNRSQGLVKNLIRIIRALVADSTVAIEVDQQGHAQVVVRAVDPATTITELTAQAAIGFLREAVNGAVRVIFEYAAQPDGDTFFTATSGYLDGQADPGELLLVLREEDGLRFPEFGTVTVTNAGGATETLSYYYRTHDTLFLTSAVAGVFQVGSLVTLDDGTLRGLAGVITFASDQTVDLTDENNTPTTATIVAGDYTIDEVLTSLASQAPSDSVPGWTFSYSYLTDRVTIDYPHTIFSVTWSTAPLQTALGYTVNAADSEEPFVAEDPPSEAAGGKLIGALD